MIKGIRLISAIVLASAVTPALAYDDEQPVIYTQTDNTQLPTLPAYYAHAVPQPPLGERIHSAVRLWRGFYVSGRANFPTVSYSDFTLPDQDTTLSNAALTKPNLSTNKFTGGLALGYSFRTWSNWGFPSRLEIEYTYLGKDKYDSSPALTNAAIPQSVKASISNQVAMVNIYHDFTGIWARVIPYIGGGAGFNFNSVDSTATTYNDPDGPRVVADNKKKQNFAWDIRGGMQIKVTNSLYLDAAYQYISLGKTSSWQIVDSNVQINKINAHGATVGLTWQF